MGYNTGPGMGQGLRQNFGRNLRPGYDGRQADGHGFNNETVDTLLTQVTMAATALRHPTASEPDATASKRHVRRLWWWGGM